MKCFLYCVLMSLLCVPLQALPAFPGAEGHSFDITGGRGGNVYHVTNLSSSGPGSFAHACAVSGPRIIVFDTCGVIWGDVTISSGDLTIAGETAPGGGITLAGRLWTEYSYDINNIIVRFIRIRPDDLSGNQGDAVQFSRSSNFIFDHVSVSWGSDETIDVYEAKNITFQWCTIEASATHAGHPDGEFHNYGMINGPDGGPATIHHCLWAHHNHRTPAIANGPSAIINNVVYNTATGFVHHNITNDAGFNFIGNYYKTGPTRTDMNPWWFDDEDENPGSYYLHDNYIDDPGDFDGVLENPWEEEYSGIYWYGGTRATTPFVVPAITISSSPVAYEMVLAKAGCLPHDTVTRRTMLDVQERSGEWGRSVPDDLFAGLERTSVPTDTDEDGMPDWFEDSIGTVADVADDNEDLDEDGYTNIEHYLHYCAAEKMGEQPLTTTPIAPYRSASFSLGANKSGQSDNILIRLDGTRIHNPEKIEPGVYFSFPDFGFSHGVKILKKD
ncbi:MAG: pectate lyase precursor [Fibrobacteria bacterium]|nr:pectate lyase precursor [Fibrobacteria bacterium]